MNPVRIGKTIRASDGAEVIVVELFGVPLAESFGMVADFDRENDFVEYWTEYFLKEIVATVADRLNEKRRPPQGWIVASPLAPPLERLPREGEET